MKYDTVYVHKLLRDNAVVEIEINFKDAMLIECLKDDLDIDEKVKKIKLSRSTIQNSETALVGLLNVKSKAAITKMFANIDLKPYLKPDKSKKDE